MKNSRRNKAGSEWMQENRIDEQLVRSWLEANRVTYSVRIHFWFPSKTIRHVFRFVIQLNWRLAADTINCIATNWRKKKHIVVHFMRGVWRLSFEICKYSSTTIWLFGCMIDALMNRKEKSILSTALLPTVSVLRFFSLSFSVYLSLSLCNWFFGLLFNDSIRFTAHY